MIIVRPDGTLRRSRDFHKYLEVEGLLNDERAFLATRGRMKVQPRSVAYWARVSINAALESGRGPARDAIY